MTPLSQPHYDFLMEKIADKTLDFGCKIILHYDARHLEFYKDNEEADEKICVLIKKYPHGNCIGTRDGEHWVLIYPDSRSLQNFDIKDVEHNNTKIIGHEPTLARVLMHLEGKDMGDYILDEGCFSFMTYNEDKFEYEERFKWELQNDRLSAQSDETIIWLAELFGFSKSSQKQNSL